MPNIGDLNLNQSVPQAEMWLAKPDRTLLGKLTQRASVGFSRFGKRTKMLKHSMLYKLNNVNEMDFSVPYELEINHELVKNPIIDLIRDRYLIKVLYNGTEEWFVITDIINAMDGAKNLKILKARSLSYEMINRGVRQLDLVSVNLSTLLNGGNVMDSKGNTFVYNGLLGSTLWTLDPSYDVTFDTIYRAFNVTKATVLDVIFQASKTFNAICVFDTVNRRINFKQLINIGQDKGFKISYKSYMKSVENESKSDELATIFIPTGKNNLGISGVTSNGQNFLSDYSFFMYPFSRDINKVVLQHSNYMSDSLCNALMDYTALANSKSGQFTTLLNSLTTYQTQLTTKNNEMTTLVTQLKVIQNQLDIAQTTGASTTSLLSQQTNQNSLISTKQSEINAVNANITSTQNSITSLQTTLSSSNNFTPAQLAELSYYSFEKTWEAPNITDAQSLYNQAIIEFPKWSMPQTIVKVDMVNLLEMQMEQRNFDKLTPVSLGDTISIVYNTIGTNIKAKLVEFSIDHVNSNITLTIANVDDLKRDEEKVYAMLYRGVGASNSLGVNSSRWDGIDQVTTNVNAIYNSGIDSAKIAIASAVSNSVTINNRGITITDSANANRFLRATNGVIGLTKDNGNTFSTCISADGIYAPLLVGQMLLSSALTITNQSGTVTINGNGMTVAGASLTITAGLSDGNISSSGSWNTAASQASNSVQLGSTYNSVVISAANGIVATASNNLTKTILNGTAGIKIQKNVSGTWTDQLFADTNGNLSVVGSINCTALSINGTNVLNGTNIINGAYVNNINANTITAGTINASVITVTNLNASNITTGTINASVIAVTNINANNITVGNITGLNIIGSYIQGGTITSNTDINVTRDITLGSNINLTNATNTAKQSIVAPGGGSISWSGGLITISASSQVAIDVGRITQNGADIATQTWVKNNPVLFV